LPIFEPITNFRKNISKHFKNRFKYRENTAKPEQNCKNLKFFKENQGYVEIVAGSDANLVSGNYHEKYGPVVMEMASAKAEIRHVFGFTFFAEQVLQ
jgi:hypothetical protein